MSLFRAKRCVACESKDDTIMNLKAAHERERKLYEGENAYLRGLVTRLQDRLLELTEPGILRRIPTPPRPAGAPPEVPRVNGAAAILAADKEREAREFVPLPPL